MNNLFLYLKILRAVTLFRKENLDHINPIRSRKTLDPALGAFGRIREAGVLTEIFLQLYDVGTAMLNMNITGPAIPYRGRKDREYEGIRYISLNILKINTGSAIKPMRVPIRAPIIPAAKAYIIYLSLISVSVSPKLYRFL